MGLFEMVNTELKYEFSLARILNLTQSEIGALKAKGTVVENID